MTKSSIVIKGLLVVIILAGLGVALARPVQAADIEHGGQVAAGETISDDVFLSGNNVEMDGTVNGILFAAGNQVVINGTVNGDVYAFGQNVVLTETAKVDGNLFTGARSVDVRGNVTGSVFGASASAVLGSKAAVGRNLFYGGYSLQTLAGSKVNTDLYAGAYQVLLSGDVNRDLKASAGAVELNGKVGRNAVLDVSTSSNKAPSAYTFPFQYNMPPSVQPGLRIGSGAVISGDLTYTSPNSQSSSILAQPEGQVIYQTPVPNQKEINAAGQPRIDVRIPILGTIFKMVRDLITLLALGGLAFWLIPRVFEVTVEQARVRTLPSAGVGVLSVLAGYIGAFLVAILLIGVGLLLTLVTLGGLSKVIFGVGFSGLALFMTLFTLLVTYGSKLVVSYLVGNLLMGQLAPNASNKRLWSLLIGVVIYVLLRYIPFVGWLFGLVATIIGLGAMWYAYRTFRRRPAEVEPVAQVS